MDKEAFDDYLKNRYEDQLSYYDRAAGKNQKKYKRYQWVLIVLSALTPVLAALNGKQLGLYTINAELVNVVVVVIASIVAILTTGLKTFNYQELWITYRSTHEKLKHELYYYRFDIGGYNAADVDKESLFVSRVEAILSAEHKDWPLAKQINRAEDNNDGKGDK